jgi:hypothetical protein
MHELVLSSLNHTWILDLDGTIVKHNGYKIDGKDTLLPGAKKFLDEIPKDDMILFLTSREKKYQELTEHFLTEHNIRYDYIIYGAPYGERILVNDDKPSGLRMAYVVNGKRDREICIKIDIDDEL